MMRLALLLLIVVASGCATDDDAAGTDTPAVDTPAEVPAAAGDTPDEGIPADSSVSVP